MPVSHEKECSEFIHSFMDTLNEFLSELSSLSSISDLMALQRKSEASERLIARLHSRASANAPAEELVKLEKAAEKAVDEVVLGAVRIAIKHSSVDEVAAMVPLDKLYPELKDDLHSLGYGEIANLAAIAEKNAATPAPLSQKVLDNKLLHAAEHGKISEVTTMLSNGANVNATYKKGFLKGMTPLQFAAMNGHEDVVEALLTQPGIDLDAMNIGGTTALMIACRQGSLGIVKTLLAHPRTDANFLGEAGGTALMNAAGFGHMDVVKELLKVPGIRLDPTYTREKHSPITIARLNGHETVAKLLEDFAAARAQKAKPGNLKPPGV